MSIKNLWYSYLRNKKYITLKTRKGFKVDKYSKIKDLVIKFKDSNDVYSFGSLDAEAYKDGNATACGDGNATAYGSGDASSRATSTTHGIGNASSLGYGINTDSMFNGHVVLPTNEKSLSNAIALGNGDATVGLYGTATVHGKGKAFSLRGSSESYGSGDAICSESGVAMSHKSGDAINNGSGNAYSFGTGKAITRGIGNAIGHNGCMAICFGNGKAFTSADKGPVSNHKISRYIAGDAISHGAGGAESSNGRVFIFGTGIGKGPQVINLYKKRLKSNDE